MKETKVLISYKLMIILLSTLTSGFISAQNSFQMIVLGSGGGVDESNLSGYLLASANNDKYICLDAGSLMHGIELAYKNNQFEDIVKTDKTQSLPANILLYHIDAYAISHPHLDHIMGMLIAAPFDHHKSIICSERTANVLMEHVFESPLWGNFTTEGAHAVGKWDILRLKDEEWKNIPNNTMRIKSYKLCHSCPNESNAFLIESEKNYCLYFGDTGADEIDGQNKMRNIFNKISALVKHKQLKAIFIEVSFPNGQNNKQLYGHLKPELLNHELDQLAQLVSPNNKEHAFDGLKIFITHMKPNFQHPQNSREIIIEECEKIPHYGATFIYPKQGEKYKF